MSEKKKLRNIKIDPIDQTCIQQVNASSFFLRLCFPHPIHLFCMFWEEVCESYWVISIGSAQI